MGFLHIHIISSKNITQWVTMSLFAQRLLIIKICSPNKYTYLIQGVPSFMSSVAETEYLASQFDTVRHIVESGNCQDLFTHYQADIHTSIDIDVHRLFHFVRKEDGPIMVLAESSSPINSHFLVLQCLSTDFEWIAYFPNKAVWLINPANQCSWASLLLSFLCQRILFQCCCYIYTSQLLRCKTLHV